VRASDINEPMKIAASKAIASLVENVSEECIIPSPLDRRVVPAVAAAVARAAIETGAARRPMDPEDVRRNARKMVQDLEKSTCVSG
jgi:malate dehydrogenase (oxaloacetate-decarboxylating)